ncbi:protein crumbs homolog 1-like [Notolabrus celidotus]|uniref:protein crumbs homolog 1-like n=1 Tax=Notolabrus celidotus TaxID=1203425 RepID=UPI00149053D0|nr:protein crumbs homolog 1-like [Notolabrus celidotus]
MCSPLLVNNQHNFTCFCLAGFTGSQCQTATTFSFESRGYMYIETQLLDPEAPLNVTFSFRTARPVGTLWQHRVDDLLLRIELDDGHLCLRSLKGQGSNMLVQELPENLSDSKWHTVEASLGGEVSLIKLLCTEGSCTRDFSTDIPLLEQASALPDPGTVRQGLFIGVVGRNWGLSSAEDESENPPAFLGCFRDVFVGSHLVLPVVAPGDSDAQANITVGCSDKDKCEESPCQNRGRCVSQGWRSYLCECHRPYEGQNCAEGGSNQIVHNITFQPEHAFALQGESISPQGLETKTWRVTPSSHWTMPQVTL